MSTLRLAARGALDSLGAEERAALLARRGLGAVARTEHPPATDLSATVARIIGTVRSEGDDALRLYARLLDGVDLGSIEVPPAACRAALEGLDPPVRAALTRAARNIRAVHETFRPEAQELVTDDGVEIGRRPDPLARVGVYAPGGRASYPSSLLMGAIPARVAGVGEVVVCTPPGKDGAPNAVVLAAAALAGVDRVFAVGGAGAIAAMAYGTASIPRVDRIVGPGNAYVAEAKLQVSRMVGIDSPAGPSELVIVADDAATPDVLVNELLAQAEHDPEAAVVLLTDSAALVDAVAEVLTARLANEPRAEIIRAALAGRGALLTARTLSEALAFANEYAPEHLLLAVREPTASALLAEVRSAGTVFVGERSSVAFGDYLTGANHVLPTGGLARTYSGLSTLDFVRWTTWQRVGADAAASLATDTDVLALAEGLPAHAAAARRWGIR